MLVIVARKVFRLGYFVPHVGVDSVRSGLMSECTGEEDILRITGFASDRAHGESCGFLKTDGGDDRSHIAWQPPVPGLASGGGRSVVLGAPPFLKT